MQKKLPALAIAATSLMSTSAFADAPAPGQVTIQSIESSGPGCYPGSVAKNISDDGKAMTLLFDDFLVEAGPDVAPQQSKSCNIKLGMKVPAGWSYSLFCVDFRGYADLDRNVKASQSATYTFDGTRKTKVGELNLVGPVAVDYEHLTQLPVNALSWSPCSTGELKPLTIDANIAVSLPPSVALEHRTAKKRADDIGDAARGMAGKVRRMERALYDTVKQLTDQAENLEDLFDHGKPLPEVVTQFNVVQNLVRKVADRIAANAALRNNRTVSKRWAEIDDAMRILAPMVMPASPDAGGLMTVDSVDGNLKHHYGIAWKRCNPHQPVGQWVQGDGRKRCDRVCSEKGLTLGRSPDGAQCVSGEARPLSAEGKIEFKLGCWSDCSTQGAVQTDVVGRMCYRPGQKRDNDRTDRAVGCFCK